jgi:hypothetical protein
MRGRPSSLDGRAHAVIPACPESDGAERFTTKPPRHQGKNNREYGEVREERPILWEASPDADTAEGREKHISPQRSQRTRRNTDERGAFVAPSALVGAAWAARRKASQLLSLMNILLNSKFKIYNSPRFPPRVPSRLLALRAFGRPLFPVIATLAKASGSNPALLAFDNGPF